MTISQTTANLVLGVQVHRAPVRPAETSSATQNDASGRNMTQGPRRIVQDRAEQDLHVRPDSQAPASNPRRMIAVTVALSLVQPGP